MRYLQVSLLRELGKGGRRTKLHCRSRSTIPSRFFPSQIKHIFFFLDLFERQKHFLFPRKRKKIPILKFWFNNAKITLDHFTLQDISSDHRTSLLDKKSFIKDEFKIADNIYLAQNDLFFKFSKFFTKADIHAMLFKEGERHVIIVPSRSYVFWNGRSVEAGQYQVLQGEGVVKKILGLA